MTKKMKIYQALTFVFMVTTIILLLIVGITAVQKAMKLKLGFNMEPSIYCYIEYKAPNEANSQYKPLFSNVTNTGAGLTPSVTANASLSGNTLTLTTEFEELGASFDFKIFNYNNFGLKVTCAGLSKSTSANTSVANVATNANPIVFTSITTGGEKIVFSFEEYNTYTITFNANGGSGEMQAMEVEVGQPVILVTNSFTNSGYSFNGWNTKPDGTGTSYANLANFTPNSNITLYAMWKVAEFTITYENIVCVDATADNSANPTTYKDTTPTFTLEEPTKTGCEFLGWTWEGQTEPQKSVTITQGTTGNKTYKANWGATLMAGGNGVICFNDLLNIYFRSEVSLYAVFPGAHSVVTSVTFGYWEDYKKDVLVNEFVNSENTIAYGLPIDANQTGSIRIFGNGTKAYILSPNKIFANANSINLFAANFDTGGTEDYNDSITEIIFDNFDTSKTTNMFRMFAYFKGTTLDLSCFDTSNVTNMYNMFAGCNNLKTIYVANSWSVASGADTRAMFSGCTALKGGNGTGFNSSYTDATYARIDTASTPGYFTLKT